MWRLICRGDSRESPQNWPLLPPLCAPLRVALMPGEARAGGPGRGGALGRAPKLPTARQRSAASGQVSSRASDLWAVGCLWDRAHDNPTRVGRECSIAPQSSSAIQTRAFRSERQSVTLAITIARKQRSFAAIGLAVPGSARAEAPARAISSGGGSVDCGGRVLAQATGRHREGEPLRAEGRAARLVDSDPAPRYRHLRADPIGAWGACTTRPGPQSAPQERRTSPLGWPRDPATSARRPPATRVARDNIKALGSRSGIGARNQRPTSHTRQSRRGPWRPATRPRPRIVRVIPSRVNGKGCPHRPAEPRVHRPATCPSDWLTPCAWRSEIRHRPSALTPHHHRRDSALRPVTLAEDPTDAFACDARGRYWNAGNGGMGLALASGYMHQP